MQIHRNPECCRSCGAGCSGPIARVSAFLTRPRNRNLTTTELSARGALPCRENGGTSPAIGRDSRARARPRSRLRSPQWDAWSLPSASKGPYRSRTVPVSRPLLSPATARMDVRLAGGRSQPHTVRGQEKVGARTSERPARARGEHAHIQDGHRGRTSRSLTTTRRLRCKSVRGAASSTFRRSLRHMRRIHADR
jgi:hypothetical protein